MKKINVLVACEESQAVFKAFRKLGHNAFSCDLQPCSGGYPEWHIQEDVRNVIDLNVLHWDLIIAHPPCTYLSKAGATSLYPNGKLNLERYDKLLAAREFFMYFYNCRACEHICIENPIPFKIAHLPSCDQIIQPYEFGHPYSKRTLLWLKNLPFLRPTGYVRYFKPYVFSCSGSKKRSKTFQGIADAMADQWSEYLTCRC